ncbi:MAG: TonB-dependent receptor [Pseudomonadota bacterium]
MRYDRKYLICGLTYAVAGMALGMAMAASHDHGQLVTHAHLLLVGFVTSMMYAIIHKLWLHDLTPRVATVQFIVHNLGAVTMIIALFLLFQRTFPEEQLGPILGMASTTVMTGMLLMYWMVIKTGKLDK